MAKLALTNAYLSINGVDLSASVRSMSLTASREILDTTTMGDSARERTGGLTDWSLSVEFFNDYAASAVDATLSPLVGSTFTVIVKPNGSATSVTNPSFTGTGILESYLAVGGSVGEMVMAPITIQGSGTLARATS